MANRLDGKLVAKAVKDSARQEVEALKARGIEPALDVILVGENPASQVYVKNKAKDCAQVGITSHIHTMPENAPEADVIALVKKLNQDPSVSGILVQLPLPAHINEDAIISAINPMKDVDAFSAVNVGKISQGNFTFAPCTPSGVMELLHYYEIPLAGKSCVIVGRSNIVGKPMSMLMLHENATVTICHSRTQDLPAVTRQADILVAAVGRRDFITGDMVKEGAVVVDVGINRKEDGKLCGDVDFEAVEKKASWITPVPGGVGPMTRAILMKNTVQAAKLQKDN